MSQETEPIQGPVPKWEPSLAEKALTERLLASDDELDRAYGEAYEAGCFVTEFGDDDETHGIAAVGEMDTLALLEFRLGKEINPQELSMGDCIALGAHPGGAGSNRAERVRNGLEMVLEARAKKNDPDTLDLFGSFTENGYRVDAFMPANSRQQRQWTVRVYKEGDEEPTRVVNIPMVHEPIFGVDVSDKAALENKVDEIMRELTA